MKKGLKMPNQEKKPAYVCVREKQVNKHEVDIAELKARADFKDLRIDELRESIDDMDKKLDKIDHALSDIQRQSERDDFNIDSRVTKLENTQNVLKWIIGIGLTAIGTTITVLTFILTNLH